MHSIEQLVALQTKSNGSITKMESAIATLNNMIERHEADKSRSQSYILESVKRERLRLLPTLTTELEIVRGAAKESQGQKKFWESRPLLLSLQKFSAQPEKDAQIRMAYAAELRAVTLPLLAITLENAKDEQNLPLAYQCFLAGIGRSSEAGFTDSVNLSLEGLDIPDEKQALAAISQCWSNVSFAESMAAVASGLRSDPVRKMNVAREQLQTSRLVQAANAGL